jgi:hypothetical protein
MNLGLRTFLGGIIDYAGLFPPARLPLEQAIRAYVRYTRGDDAWMLGRFVCPAARFPELTPLGRELFVGVPVLFAALGRGGATIADFLSGLSADLEAVSAFRETHGSGVDIDVLETRLPVDAFASPDLLTTLLDTADSLIGGSRLNVYYETSFDDSLMLAASCLAGRRGRGIKIRCGGLQPGDFPDGARVSRALLAAAQPNVALKATAGLHHPLPRLDATIPARMHGFVNLFAAGIFARTIGLAENELNTLLADEDATHFQFSDEGLRWGEKHATVREIAAARRTGMTSFGSCSFDEPREDLRALGWL